MTGYAIFNRTEDCLFAFFFSPALKLIVSIKMILDCLFAASCDDYDFSDIGTMGSLTTWSIMVRSYSSDNSFGIA